MTLQIFVNMSDLTLNLRKSEIIITSADPEQARKLVQILQCKAAQFPLKYLRLSFFGQTTQKTTLPFAY
jgi:hypothetical protein